MPSVDWNKRAWSERHRWDLDGDEWTGMARHCGQPYEVWKQTLVDEFIVAYVKPDDHAMEIAPGHGRWTGHLLGRASRVTVVDINQTCLDACHERFARPDRLRAVRTDGWHIPEVDDASVDFAWSFDSFVHMDAPVIRGYLDEFSRVLRPGGVAVLHHAGMRDWSVRLGPLTARFGRPGRAVQRLAGQGRLRQGGNRSAVSRESMRRFARSSGLVVDRQTESWGPAGEYDVRRFGDWITVLIRPG